MSPSLDPKHVPQPWRHSYTLALFVGTVLSAALVAYGVVHGIAHRVATDVVNEKWDERFRVEVTQIATSAAVAASAAAVERVTRDQIGPLKERLDRHEPLDDKRVATLETTVAACCPVVPAVPRDVLPPDRRRWIPRAPGGGG